MKQNYYFPLKGSTGEKPMEPTQDTIRRILEFSKTLKIIHTKTMMVEVMLN